MNTWLKNRRKQLHISQEELANQLQLRGVDVSRGMVSHWENDRNKLPMDAPDFVNALAETLNLSVSQVLALSGYEIPKEGYSGIAKRAADIIEQMPPNRQTTAIGILEQLLKEG